MIEVKSKVKNTVRIYGCGGAGVNIGDWLSTSLEGVNTNNLPDISVSAIDTSLSNIKHLNNEPKDVFIVKDKHGNVLDGAGQNRREIHPHVVAAIPKILLDIPPLDFNIVVFPAAGGSGSVISGEIIAELLKRDEKVIALIIGASDTTRNAENSLNVLRGLENISVKCDKPVVARYYENGTDGTRAEVDRKVTADLILLLTLLSGNNGELDTRDLYNWLNYPKVTSFKPHLSLMAISPALTSEEIEDNVVAVATLAKVSDDTRIKDVVVDYQTVGFLSGEVEEDILAMLPTHFIITSSGVAEIALRHAGYIKEAEKKRNAREKEINILDVVDNELGDESDSGLIL